MRALDPYRAATGLDVWKASGLFAIGRQRRFNEREILLAQSDAASHAALITRGLVKVTAEIGQGKQIILAVRSEGDFFGEEAAIMGKSPQTGRKLTIATTLTRVTAQVFPAENLRDFLEGHPAAMSRIARGLCERVADAEARIASAAFDNADRRLARLLCDLGRYGIQDGDGLALPGLLTQAELASWVGTSRETADRALRGWRERGIVSTSHRRIVIRNVDTLARIAGIDVSRPAIRPGRRHVIDRHAVIDSLRTKPDRRTTGLVLVIPDFVEASQRPKRASRVSG